MSPKNDAEARDQWDELQRAVDEHLAATENAHLAQLGREFVEAMRAGRRLSELAEKHPFSELKSGRIVANPLFTDADRELRRGMALAKALELTKPRSEPERDPLAELDGKMGVRSLADARRERERKGSS